MEKIFNEVKSNYNIQRGDLIYVNLGDKFSNIGSEQLGSRYAIVLQNDIGNKVSPTIVIAPCTSKQTKHNIPTHVRVGYLFDKSDKETIVLLEQIRTIDKSRIKYNYGKIPNKIMKEIDKSLKISLGLL